MVEWKWIAPIRDKSRENLMLSRKGRKKKVLMCHRSSICCDI